MRKTKFSIRAAIISMIIAALSMYMISGCAPPPTGVEFKQETPPSVQTQTTEQTQQKPVPGKIEGYEIYENNDPFQPRTGPGSATQVTTAITPSGGTTSSSATLESISTNQTKATINVNGTSYADIAVGATFAESFKLLSIVNGSVTILYGDNQYTLYLNQTLTLK